MQAVASVIDPYPGQVETAGIASGYSSSLYDADIKIISPCKLAGSADSRRTGAKDCDGYTSGHL